MRRCTCCLSLCNGELVCVCKVEKEVCREEVYMLSLWKHECTRVIADRFIQQTDKAWFDDCMLKVRDVTGGSECLKLQQHFGNFKL